jgi:hypothetical protein
VGMADRPAKVSQIESQGRCRGRGPRIAAEPSFEGQGFFRADFPGPEGRRMDPDYFDAFIFGRIAAHAGLSHVRFHDLRHFFASMLIAQGESAKYVCDQMGHSSIQVTFDTYGHLFPNSRETAAKKLQQAMFTGRKKGFGNSLDLPPFLTQTVKTQNSLNGELSHGIVS